MALPAHGTPQKHIGRNVVLFSRAHGRCTSSRNCQHEKISWTATSQFPALACHARCVPLYTRQQCVTCCSAADGAHPYPVWPNPAGQAPELTDVPTLEDIHEPLSARLQRYCQVSVTSALLLACDRGMKALLTSLGVQFPHTLAGMILIVIVSVSAKACGGKLGQAVDATIDFFEPLRSWVARWMPIFFVPFLISLPLATAGMPSSDAIRVAQVTLGGWLGSLLVGSLTVQGIRKVVHTELTVSEEEATAPRPVSPFTPGHYLAWAIISAAAFAAAAALPQHHGVTGTAFLLASTVEGYLLGVAVPPSLKLLLHPIIVCSLYSSACCKLWSVVSSVPYPQVLTSFMDKEAAIPGAGALLMSMLVVVVLCDGMRVYLQRSVVKRHSVEIVGTVLVSSLVSLFATAKLAAVVGLSSEVARSLLPRSITTPLALPMTQALGGSPSITAASVCLTGLVGAAFGQAVMSRLQLRDEISRGVAQASSAHGLGASAMASTEPQALPFCAVTIAIMGTVSNVLLCVPVVKGALLAITG